MIASLPDLIAKRAMLSPDAVAMEEYGSGRSVTYAELDRRAARAAAVMAEHGIGAGDRVAILSRNCIAFFELLFGCAKLGAIFVPLNWRMPARELDHLIEDCAPKLLFHGTEDAGVPNLMAAPPPTIALGENYEASLEAARPRPFRDQWPASDIWYLLYTSGTTGRPKGVIHSFGMALANHVNIGSTI
ncbi:MAG TPA: AMP-binding protein, partial [Allosphingosinicella sp.]